MLSRAVRSLSKGNTLARAARSLSKYFWSHLLCHTSFTSTLCPRHRPKTLAHL